MVSRRLPTAVVRVQALVRSCELYGGQSGTGGRFSLSTSVSPLNLYSTDCPTITDININHLGLVQ
jgi:hypothetical protein